MSFCVCLFLFFALVLSYIIWKYFLPVHRFFSQSFNRLFHRASVSDFDEVNFSLFSFLWIMLSMASLRTLSLVLVPKHFLICFVSNFIILLFTLKFMIYFGLQRVRLRLRFFILPRTCTCSSKTRWKGILPCLNSFCTFVKNSLGESLLQNKLFPNAMIWMCASIGVSTLLHEWTEEFTNDALNVWARSDYKSKRILMSTYCSEQLFNIHDSKKLF